MSILIRGMEMPTSCQHCFASDDESRFCRAANEYIPMLGKPNFCPLVPVPPHGDLIDRDALKNKHHWTDDFYETEYVEVEDIDAAPTIIPASEEGE